MSLYSRHSARRSLIDTILYRVLSQVATVLSFVVLVRALSEQDFGVFSLLYAVLPAVSAVASLGLEQVLRRYTPEYLRAGNQPAAMWLVRFIGSARFGSNLVILGVLLLAWNYVAPTFKLGPYRVQFMLFCGLALLHFQMNILQLALASHMLHRYSVGAAALLAYCKLAGYALLSWHGTLSLEAAILVDTAGYAICWGVLKLAYRRHCVVPGPSYKPDQAERKRLVTYGLYNNFNDAGSLLLNSRTDNFFIAAIIDPLSVAVYAFYTRLQSMIDNQLPVMMFNNVINPMFFSQSREDAARNIPRYFSLLLNINQVVQWPILTAALLFHHQIVELVFAGKYLEYSWLMPIIAGFWIINGIATPVTMVAQYYERANVILWSKITVVLNIVLLLVLVPPMGVYGAALATGVATVAKNLFIWWFVRREAVWVNAVAAVGSALAVWGGAALVVIGLRHLFDMPALLQLAAGVVVLGIAMLVYLRTPALSLSDRAILASMLKGREVTLLRRIGLVKDAA